MMPIRKQKKNWRSIDMNESEKKKANSVMCTVPEVIDFKWCDVEYARMQTNQKKGKTNKWFHFIALITMKNMVCFNRKIDLKKFKETRTGNHTVLFMADFSHFPFYKFQKSTNTCARWHRRKPTNEYFHDLFIKSIFSYHLYPSRLTNKTSSSVWLDRVNMSKSDHDSI